MTKPHIVAATDFSDLSLQMCEPVATLALALDARLTLLHVVVDPVTIVAPGIPSVPAMPAVAPDLEEALKTARGRLEELRGSFAPLERIGIEAVRGLDVAETIVEQAEALDADMIAMATHGRSGLERLFGGSVAEGVVRKSSIPLLLYPQRAADSDDS